MKHHKIIGIAGKAGSGRTTLSKAIEKRLGINSTWPVYFAMWRRFVSNPRQMLPLMVGSDVMIVQDLSREIHAAWVRKNGGLVIHVTRPGHDAITDSGIKVMAGDVEMFNCDTLQQFQYAVAQLFEGVKS